MQIIPEPSKIRQIVCEQKASGRRVGFVPTMGALHEGHLSLVRAARERSDFVVVSIFVNPTQFGPNEDFEKYPRTLEQDADLLRSAGADLVFVPTSETMYPIGSETFVEVGAIAAAFEGEVRPGHFRGVATVVLKLFNIVGADTAFFGQKDCQQVGVLRKMVEDLNVPIELVVCPTVREPDGLAMSSRNRYLSAEERAKAPVLFQSLQKAEQMIVRENIRDAAAILETMRQIVLSAKAARIDYIALVDPRTFRELDILEDGEPVLALLAVRIGTTRLIDNHLIKKRNILAPSVSAG